MPSPKCNQLQRAQVIATYDYIKAEMPDVFFIDPAFLNAAGTYTGAYPIRFTGLPYPGTPLNAPASYPAAGNYILPMGHMVQGPRNHLTAPTIPTAPYPWTTGYGDSHFDAGSGNLVSTHPELGYSGTGINGASYAAAAGLYKNLGMNPIGYDLQDNNNDGLVDDWGEATTGLTAAQLTSLTSALQQHTHNTARAEMLYALLVEGSGPLGSAFSRDDFTDKEVRDTDGDGLPEFVDAWGQPLQFFRWPILYHSDIQRGQTVLSVSRFAVQSGSSLCHAHPALTKSARAARARPDRRQPATCGPRLVRDQYG